MRAGVYREANEEEITSRRFPDFRSFQRVSSNFAANRLNRLERRRGEMLYRLRSYTGATIARPRTDAAL